MLKRNSHFVCSGIIYVYCYALYAMRGLPLSDFYRLIT